MIGWRLLSLADLASLICWLLALHYPLLLSSPLRISSPPDHRYVGAVLPTLERVTDKVIVLRFCCDRTSHAALVVGTLSIPQCRLRAQSQHGVV